MSPRIKPLRTRRWKATDKQGVTPEELQQMIEVSKDDRHALRNECMLLVGFSFGLRVSELLSLRVAHIDLKDERIHIEALKSGKTQDIDISKACCPSLEGVFERLRTEAGRLPVPRTVEGRVQADEPWLLPRLVPKDCGSRWTAGCQAAPPLPAPRSWKHQG